jgi:hypothetical protein
MVDEVLQALAGWESLDAYKLRTGRTVLKDIHDDGSVIAFTDKDPWFDEIKATVIDGKTYLQKS